RIVADAIAQEQQLALELLCRWQRGRAPEHRRDAAERASKTAADRRLMRRRTFAEKRLDEIVARLAEQFVGQPLGRELARDGTIGVVHDRALALPRYADDALDRRESAQVREELAQRGLPLASN